MYSQSKGRHLNVGQHKELLSYLLSICPLIPRYFSRQNTRDNTKLAPNPCAIFLVKTQEALLRLCHLTIFCLASKPSGCTVRVKAGTSTWANEELLSYLLSIFPLHPGDFSRQITRNNTKIMPFNDIFFSASKPSGCTVRVKAGTSTWANMRSFWVICSAFVPSILERIGRKIRSSTWSSQKYKNTNKAYAIPDRVVSQFY